MGKRAQDRLRPRKDVEIIRTGKRPSKPVAYRKPETTSSWEKLQRIKISGRDECLDAFMRISREVEKGKYKFVEGAADMGKYFVVNEEERQGSSFVHVVPAEAYKIFEEMRREMPTSILGFSMLCGKNGKRALRVSCFAIPTSDITRAMISKRA